MINFKDNKNLVNSLSLSLKLSSWILFPLLIGALIGKYLDKKYNSEPWIFLGLTMLAFVVSMFGLIKNTLKEYKNITQTSQEEKREENQKTDDGNK